MNIPETKKTIAVVGYLKYFWHDYKRREDVVYFDKQKNIAITKEGVKYVFVGDSCIAHSLISNEIFLNVRSRASNDMYTTIEVLRRKLVELDEEII